MASPYDPASAPLRLVGPVLIPENAVPQSAGAMSIMSKWSRDGDWLLPRLFRALAVMGELNIDLTRVRLGAGVSVLELKAVMGQINVRVPYNLRVECHGGPVMGEMKVSGGQAGVALDDAPLLVINASGLMSSIFVTLVDPNAAAWRDQQELRLRSR